MINKITERLEFLTTKPDLNLDILDKMDIFKGIHFSLFEFDSLPQRAADWLLIGVIYLYKKNKL